ncbi:Cytochrome P450 2F1 [Manis javanica]|nr:Cytochrome P450 2F1 [Manis javanica]
MKQMEERYKKYLEKAKSVIRTLDPKQNQGAAPEIQALKNQLQEWDRLFHSLGKEYEKMKSQREMEEKCIVSTWYNTGMNLHKKAVEDRLASTGPEQRLELEHAQSCRAHISRAGTYPLRTHLSRSQQIPAAAFNMDTINTAILILFLAITCLFLTFSSKSKGRLPPGPTPLPLLGNLLHLRFPDLLTSLTKLSKKYGSVYTVHLGSRPVVVLSGYHAVKEALVDQAEEFSGRGDFPVFFNFTKGNGIAFSNGDRWKALRRFSIQILRNFGMGKRSIEERILEEEGFLLAELRKTEGKPFDPTIVVSRSVANIICSVMFGSRFNYDDERLLTIIRLINDNFQIMSSPWGELYNIFPNFLDWVPGPHRRIFQNFGRMKDLIACSVREHQASLDPNSPRDFIDCFLTKMAQEQKNPESHFQEETLVMTTHNLFFGGTETTSITLRSGLLILLKYPEVTAKMQAELDAVVGRMRTPSLADREHLPYTNAVLHELQRFTSVLPLGLPRALTHNTHLHGHFLPKGTFVIPLLVSAHRDPSQFKDPDCFNPTNFLDDKGKFQSNDAFMPFALGKRMCLGAGLARSEIFLFFTTILQRFCLLPVGSPANIDLTPQCTGLGNVPPAFQLRLVAR